MQEPAAGNELTIAVDNTQTEPEPEEPDFEQRVTRLLEMMESDPSIRDRMLCEMYLAFTDFERMTRTMALNGGPMQMLKAMLKGGG